MTVAMGDNEGLPAAWEPARIVGMAAQSEGLVTREAGTPVGRICGTVSLSLNSEKVLASSAYLAVMCGSGHGTCKRAPDEGTER